MAKVQEADLFEVRERKPPPTAQVVPGAVGQEVTERRPGVVLVDGGRGAVIFLAGDQGSERDRQGLGQRVVAQPGGPGRADGFENRRADERNLDEVVEVPGLEGSVLPIVRETKKLPVVGQLGVAGLVREELPQNGQRKDRGGGRATFA